jgi:hypothetical protein
MACQKWGRPPPRDAANGLLNCRSRAGVDKSKNTTSRSTLKELPTRATLKRRWPGLRINRLTWRWRDDTTGARGDNFQSLLSYVGEGA